MNGLIYMLTNRTNGMRYIGQTVQPLQTRFKEHQKAARYGSKTRIAEAFREFGPECFDVTVLEEGIDSAKDLNYAEAHHIVANRTYWPDGYNMTFGGSRDASLCGRKKTPANEAYVAAYESGMTLKEVGEKFNVCACTVLKHIRKSGATCRKNSRLSRESVVADYLAGATVAELTRKYGVSRSTIKYHLNEASVARR